MGPYTWHTWKVQWHPKPKPRTLDFFLSNGTKRHGGWKRSQLVESTERQRDRGHASRPVIKRHELGEGQITLQNCSLGSTSFEPRHSKAFLPLPPSCCLVAVKLACAHWTKHQCLHSCSLYSFGRYVNHPTSYVCIIPRPTSDFMFDFFVTLYVNVKLYLSYQYKMIRDSFTLD